MGTLLQFQARQKVRCRKCGSVGKAVEEELICCNRERVDQTRTKHWKHYLSGWEKVTVIERRLVQEMYKDYRYVPYYHCFLCTEHSSFLKRQTES